jgi:UDP-glucose 6-dehydrogenase
MEKPVRRSPGHPPKVTDMQTAELSKLAANAFLATKISFINAMAELSDLTGADLVLHLTEWPQLRALDPVPMAPLVSRRRIVDGRHGLDPDRWRLAGRDYRALGCPWPPRSEVADASLACG